MKHDPGGLIARAARTALERFDQEALVQDLEDEVKAALRNELETLIRERLTAAIEKDLPLIVEEVYRLAKRR